MPREVQRIEVWPVKRIAIRVGLRSKELFVSPQRFVAGFLIYMQESRDRCIAFHTSGLGIVGHADDAGEGCVFPDLCADLGWESREEVEFAILLWFDW